MYFDSAHTGCGQIDEKGLPVAIIHDDAKLESGIGAAHILVLDISLKFLLCLSVILKNWIIPSSLRMKIKREKQSGNTTLFQHEL